MPTGQQADFSKACIYKICCRDSSITDIYVGSTTNFIKRKNKHKTNSKYKNLNDRITLQPKYNFIRDNGGWENWCMIQIEAFPCNNRRELELRERFWIEILNSTLNCSFPQRSIEDEKAYNKNYYETNKKELAKKNKEYYLKNFESIKQKRKIYRQSNKIEISTKAKEKVFCVLCDCYTVKSSMSRHRKSDKHIYNSAKLITKFFKNIFQK